MPNTRYAILPFCVFIAPPLVGFFADKLGNYVRVLLLSIVGSVDMIYDFVIDEEYAIEKNTCFRFFQGISDNNNLN